MPDEQPSQLSGDAETSKTGGSLQTSDEADVAALQAELEAHLAAGQLPDGWKHQISWDADDARVHPILTAVFILGSAVACWLAWGWKAGLTAIFVATGLRMLPAIRGGPRPGQQITESFIPPDETLIDLGVADQQLLEVTRSRPQFSLTRIATTADRRSVRRLIAGLAGIFITSGTLTLLVESRFISPATYLRLGSVLAAVVSAVVAVWLWRRIGKANLLPNPRPAVHEQSPVSAVLDSATTGSTTEALAKALWSRLPPRLSRVLLPVLVLSSGALSVLVAFTVAPDYGQLWSGLTAATSLMIFILAGVRGVLLTMVSVFLRDWAALISALLMAGLMALVLLVAKLFGWLDDWGAVINWVYQHVS